MSVSFYYFPGSCGRVEQGRLLAVDAGIEYKTIDVSDFAAMKGDGSLDFGSLPMLEDGDLRLVQGPAILMYLADKAGGSYAGSSPVERAKILSYVLGAEDLRSKTFPYYFAEDSAAAMEEFKKIVPRWYGNFERLLGDNDYFVGSDITAADIAIFDVLNAIEERILPAAADYPKLTAFLGKIGARENIKAYLEKRPKSKF